MRVGFVGLGKLGLPVALAVEHRGHEVKGYEISPEVCHSVRSRVMRHKEEHAEDLLKNSKLELTSLPGLVEWADLLFLAIQTPHQPEFEGVAPLGEARADFDYTYLKTAIGQVCREVEAQRRPTVLVVISTCLPGTFDREIAPLLNDYVDYVYSPLYIAMGTVVEDYLNPEFWLVGCQVETEGVQLLRQFYATISDQPQVVTDTGTAEFIKVAYNTFISAKIMLANAWMQVCHKMGLNVDDVTRAMGHAHKRLLSKAYLTGGGPDAGGCHPRDLIALSWLGREIDLQPNLFEMMAEVREEQTAWSAELIEEHRRGDEPVYVLGRAFKPETKLVDGSGATLLVNLLRERYGIEAIQYDPHTDEDPPEFQIGLYFVATKHECFKEFRFLAGSRVLDLWRYIPPRNAVEVIPIGGPTS